MLYSFEDLSLDTARRELRRSGALVALQPQVLDVLEYLIRNRERVVSKDDLLGAVWNGRIVSDSTLGARINAARAGIGDSGEEQRLIRTVSRKGLRFVGAVREEGDAVRKLAAIFAADVAGYSRLMGQDEIGTLRRLTACRAILDERIAACRGRIFGSAGDSVVADFVSAVDAVQCAVAVQDALAKEEQMRFRVGVHVGDVIMQGENLFGDGVNIAARLEALAEPGGICISGTVRDHIGIKLPLAFTDLGEQQAKNIARPVRVYRVHTTLTHPAANAPGFPLSRNAGEGAERRGREAGEGGAPATPALPLPDKPSIAVLPFANMSGDPEQEYFVDGMVEEIITALSRIRWLFVIARNSTYTYKGHAVDVKQVGRELGVRYVLEGSVRKAGTRVRITGQLIDAGTGTHIWADRFDGSLEDIFDLQDNVASSVAGVIEPAVQAAEIARSADRPTDLTAYELYLRALPNCHSWDRERIHSALELLEQATERDPSFGPALALAAMCHHHFDRLGGVQDPDLHRRAAVDYARRAVRAAPEDPTTIGNAAGVLGSFGGDINPAIALADRALALNPSFATGWRMSGWLRLWAGDLDVAIEHFETAFRLSPRERDGGHRMGIGEAQFLQRRFNEAIITLLAALEDLPGHAGIYRYLASCYAHMGRLDEAREMIRRLRAIAPTVMPHAMYGLQWRNPEHREFYLSGLRLAMGEER